MPSSAPRNSFRFLPNSRMLEASHYKFSLGRKPSRGGKEFGFMLNSLSLVDQSPIFRDSDGGKFTMYCDKPNLEIDQKKNFYQSIHYLSYVSEYMYNFLFNTWFTCQLRNYSPIFRKSGGNAKSGRLYIALERHMR